MPNLVEAILPNAEIAFYPRVDEVLPTSETTGNVTVNTAGSPARDSYFTADFHGRAVFETNGVTTTIFVTPSIVIHDATKDTSFQEIELKALQEVTPMLQAVVDAFAKTIADYQADLLED